MLRKRVSIAAVLLMFAAGCSGTATRATVQTPSPQSSVAVARNVRFSAHGSKAHPVIVSNMVSGHLEYQLRAQSVVYSTNLERGSFKDNTLLFYKGRKLRLTVTAPSALVDETSHNVVLTGGVLARTTAGDTLTSDVMTYDENTQLLTATGHVIASDPKGDTLTGKRAIADLDLQQIRLFGDVNVNNPASGSR